jgi:23S rRNA (cytidine2498-2'-O)-methyltransferase
VSDLSAPTAIITTDPDFADLAQVELVESVPGTNRLASLAEGVWLVSLPQSYWQLAETWRQQPPIFVRHMNPVQEATPLSRSAEAVDTLRSTALASFADLVDPSLPFSIQTRIFADVSFRAYDVNTAISQGLIAQTAAPLNVRAPQQILSVVVAPYQKETMGFLGLAPAVYNLSDWAGGKRRFAREKGQISRAEFKLLEALEVFDVALPPRGVALDLGAAPGGWTRVLRQKEQYVTAVDPAVLHPSLQQDPNVRHLQLTAEAYLEAGPDQFDLIVNDMRLDARDSARLLVAYAPYLYRHGRALMTLKLPEEKRENVIDHTFNILRRAYAIVGARQLFHNRSEITVYLKPKDSSNSEPGQVDKE